MQRSTDRILTTHTGSLPRPDELVRLIVKRLYDEDLGDTDLGDEVRRAVRDVVAHQLEAGIDVISDGEMGRPGFSNYVLERYSGFGGSSVDGTPTDLHEFPNVAARIWSATHGDTRAHLLLECVAPLELKDEAGLTNDIENLQAALNGASPDSAFMTAVTPGQITFNFPNRYYSSHEAYLQAAAETMRTEYKAITDAGFMLQLDSPDSALCAHITFKADAPSGLPDFRTHLEMAVEALNYALADIPAEQTRLHVCWGNYVGPHHHDVPIKDILPLLLRAKPSGLSFEAANPRHEHEWEDFKDVNIPDDKVLIPGVIDTKTYHIEHPRLVAQRLRRFAEIVGRENVLACTDCGFSTWVGQCLIDPDVAWAKLTAMVQGAELASNELW
jgi:5-methyltetrahydropteroyltriglutamate--homocysteine methyltransferase